jgi:outer membrane protein TolC
MLVVLFMMRGYHPTACQLLGLLPVLATAPACRSAAEHRAAADRQVYEIVRERRAELGASGEFSVDPPTGTLRERILAGELGVDARDLAPLTLVQCLEIAAESSRDFQDRREALYLTALDLTLERWRFSVQPDGSATGFFDGSGDDGEELGLLSSLGISKLFESGAQIVGDVGLDLTRDIGSGDGWSALSNLSLTITQPLLRGFGGDVVREPLTQAERNVLYEARAYERFRRSLAFEVAQRFWRLLGDDATLENEERNLANLKLLRERNEALGLAGRLSDVEVAQARQDELRAQNRVVDVRRRLEAALDDFKFFLGLPVQVEIALDASELESVGAFDERAATIGFEQAGRTALAERLDHATTRERVADATRDVRIAEDDLRPGLDASLTASGASDAGRPLVYRGDDSAWSATLGLDLALDRLPERNAYRASLIALEASERAAEESSERVLTEVREDLRGLAAARASLAIQEGAVELARRRVEGAELSQKAGRATTRDLLESQEALVEAQNAAVQARTDAALAALSLYLDMECLRVDGAGLTVVQPPREDADGAVEEERP